MSKRGAEEYITKENGSTPNNSAGSAEVKMATAAQMAKRKLAQPKSRLGNTRPSPSPSFGGAPSNPFVQVTQEQPQEQPGFANANGGFSFGTSQSFPPANSSANNLFNFQPPSAQSFTFGSTSTTPNPFANLNGSSSNDTNPNEDAMMESPQKKPAFGSIMGQANNNANGNTGFTFGQPTQQQASTSFNFGSTAKTENNPASTFKLFGAVSKPEEPTQNNLYSSTATTQPPFGGLGSGTSTPTPQQALPSFGTNTSQAPKFSFGQQSKPTESAVNGFSGISTSVPTSTNSLFNPGQTQTSESSKGPFAGFGSQTPADPKPSLFGQSTASQPPSNLFGGTRAAESPKPSHEEAKTSETAIGNPFAGLFSSKSPSPQPPSTNVPAEIPKAPIFNFGNPSTTGASLFGASVSAPPVSTNNLFNSATKTTEPTPSKLFGFGNASNAGSESELPKSSDKSDPATEPSRKSAPFQSLFDFATTKPSTSTSVFSPAKSTTTEQSKVPNVFGQSNLAPAAETIKQSDKSTTKPHDLFAPRPAPETTTPKVAESTQTPTWGGGKLFDKPTQPAPTEKTTASTTSLFGAIPKAGNNASQSASEIATQTQPQQVAPKTTTQTGLSAEPNPQRPVYTKSPARIPNYLNGEGYKEYDSNYRLRALNREFKARIAALDPQIHDFENIIRHYVAARESIGASLSLYIRNVAGTKRKNDDGINEERDIPPQYKKSRLAEVEDTVMSNDASSQKPSTSGFAPDLFRTTPSTTTSAPEKPSTTSKATEVFKSMIPASPSKTISNNKTAPVPAVNVFASIAPAAPSANLFGTLKPSEPVKSTVSAPQTNSIFGQPAPSTTPVKSPPKKSTFEMPKPIVGATAAFGALAAKNAKSFEDDLKEKRKANDFDSDEDDEAEYDKNYEEEQRNKKAKLETIAKTGFVPSFGGGGGGGGAVPSSTKPVFSFGSASSTQPNGVTGSATGSSDFGGFKPILSTSGNDKSAQLFGIKPSIETSKSPESSVSASNDADDEDVEGAIDNEGEDSEYQPDEDEDGDEQEEDDLPEDEVSTNEEGHEDDDDDDENDLQATMINLQNKGKSLFERIEAPPEKQGLHPPVNGNMKENSAKPLFNFGSTVTQPTQNSAFKPSVAGSLAGKSSPAAPEASPITPVTGSTEPHKPARSFEFTPTPPSATPTPAEGASIFSGGAFTSTPSRFEGMFGSRPSTPSNIDKNNIFGQRSGSTPAHDHTWKQGTPITFGTPDKSRDAPSVSITAPSPNKEGESKTTGNLFGNITASAKPSESSGQLGFTFGAPTPNPAPGFLGAASHLTAGSGTNSGFSSRATSPGLTDNESVATNESEDAQNDPQTSLMESRAGEENEDCIWESRAKALKFYPTGTVPRGQRLTENAWNTLGLGILRVLKDRDTGKTRVVLRAEPGASILINENLIPGVNYEQEPQGASSGGAVKFLVMENGKLMRVVLKVKTGDMAKQLAELMEENK